MASDSLEQINMSRETMRVLALRAPEAARALGISPRLLWQLTHDGAIPSVRVGAGRRKSVLYPVATLEAWLSQQAKANGGDQ